MAEYSPGNRKVSVVICTYNGEKYLEELLESVINQTYPVYEILIKDDCSTDHTTAIARKYADLYPYVHLIVNERNMGITNNFLSGFFMADGEFIAYSDQDDIWHPEKIEKLLQAIGEGNLAFSNSAVCNSSGEYLYPLIKRKLLLSEIISILDLTIWGHQILFRKSILCFNNIHSIAQSIWLDSLLPIIAFHGNDRNVVYVDEMLVFWRRHEKASSYMVNHKKYSLKHRGFMGLMTAVISYFKTKNRKQIRKYFLLLDELNGFSVETRKIIKLMSDACFFDVIRAGVICLSKYNESFPNSISIKEKTTILFKPFITIRNQSKGISELN